MYKNLFLVLALTNRLTYTYHNEKTLAAYEAHAQEYMQGTPHTVTGPFKIWIDTTLSYIKKDASICEIGTAYGRDADYMESKGYHVQRTDATEAFVTRLQKLGLNAKKFNALTDDFDSSYDLVFANAVFLHFTPDELKVVFKKIYEHVKDNGILACSFKRGTGSKWSSSKLGEPRFYCYWMEDEISQLLNDYGFEIIQAKVQIEPTSLTMWIHVIARKSLKTGN